MPGIKDVARIAGVSIATVSRVLSDSEHVRPEVRERVQAAVVELGYRPNLLARNLRAPQSKKIGLIVADIRNPFFSELSRAVEDTAYEQGFSVLLCNTDEDAEKEAIYLNLARDEHVAGLIVAPTRKPVETFSSWSQEFPLVAVDRKIAHVDVDTVTLDNVDAGYRLAMHLINNGYTRISGICTKVSSTGRDRVAGLEKALREAGFTPSVDMVRYTVPQIGAGYASTLKLLDQPQPPDAIFTDNSMLGAGALRAINERELHIPEDISLVTFDDTYWAQLTRPGITLIAQPTYEMGKTATQLLLQRIAEQGRATRQVILKGQLIVRGSTLPKIDQELITLSAGVSAPAIIAPM